MLVLDLWADTYKGWLLMIWEMKYLVMCHHPDKGIKLLGLLLTGLMCQCTASSIGLARHTLASKGSGMGWWQP